jgi:hypothetical protein
MKSKQEIILLKSVGTYFKPSTREVSGDSSFPMLACENLNRNGIGIEKDENYFKIAEQRLFNDRLF